MLETVRPRSFASRASGMPMELLLSHVRFTIKLEVRNDVKSLGDSKQTRHQMAKNTSPKDLSEKPLHLTRTSLINTFRCTWRARCCSRIPDTGGGRHRRRVRHGSYNRDQSTGRSVGEERRRRINTENILHHTRSCSTRSDDGRKSDFSDDVGRWPCCTSVAPSDGTRCIGRASAAAAYRQRPVGI